jgi:hypothetical protein
MPTLVAARVGARPAFRGASNPWRRPGAFGNRGAGRGILDKLSEQISAALDLRPGISFFALAPNGLTTLHRKTDRHFLDPRELGSETLRSAATEMLAGTSGKTSYDFDNVKKQAVFRTSALTGWKFAIAFGAAAEPAN